MSDVWHEEEYKGYSIKLFQDENAESPRKWDNLGTMICFHPNYDLGDKHNMTPEELIELVKRKDVLAFPLALLDHSGLWMKVGTSWDVDPGGWDTSRVGLIYVTHDDIRKEYGVKCITKKILESAERSLRSEVEVYSDYLEGNVVGWVVEDKNGEWVESVWGFYGKEGQKEAIKQAKGTINYRVPDDLWKAQRVGEQMELIPKEVRV